MKATLPVVLATVLLAAGCEPVGSDNTPLPSEDVAAIEDMVEFYRLAVLAREWDAVAAFYAEDGEGGPERRGEDTGDYLALLEKQSDSRWRITYLMLNSNRPPARTAEESR